MAMSGLGSDGLPHSDGDTDPKVAVVVLAYNQRELTLQCLRSLAQVEYPQYNLQIVVVDNGSTDDTAQFVRTHHPTATILETGGNLGYAGGSDFGIEHALANGADYVVLVNSDVVVAPDSLLALVAAAERDPQAGFLGPKVCHLEEPGTLQSAGISLDWRLRSCHRGQNQIDAGQFDSLAECEALSGCMILTSRRVLERIGLLDTRFFMYHEEIDWCLRARAAGYRNLYVPAARVWHSNPQLRPTASAFTTYYMARNTYLLLSQHKAGFLAVAATLFQQVVWLLNWTLNPKWRHYRAKRNGLVKALVDAALHHYGERRVAYGQ